MPISDARKKRLTATAYHEAGHAVAHIVLEMPFESATIVPNREEGLLGAVSSGYSQWMLNIHRREFRAEVRDAITITMAGPIAEELLTGWRNDAGASRDDRECWHMLYQIYGERRDRHARDLARRAKKLVVANWALVKRIANALLEYKTLSEAEVAEIVGRTSVNANS